MQKDSQYYKSLFLRKLAPFIDMLEEKQLEMPCEEWNASVTRTALSISRNPEQYLGKEIPGQSLATQIINEIFIELAQEREEIAL